MSFTQGLALFCGVAGTAFALLLSTSEAEQATSAATPASIVEPSTSLRGQVEQAFGHAGALLDRERVALETLAPQLATPALKEAMSVWESRPQERDSLRHTLRAELESLRAPASLDLAAVVTQDDMLILCSPGVDALALESRALVRSAFAAAAEPYFRDGRCTGAYEKLPIAAGSSIAAADGAAGSQQLFIVAGAPVWVRPDAPAAVVLAGRSFIALAARAEQVCKPAGKLRWQAYVDDVEAGARVVAGVNVGRQIRPELGQAIANDGVSDEPAFAREEFAPGRWQAVANRSGVLLGGWGITVDPDGLRKVVAANPVASADPWQGMRRHLREHAVWYGAGGGAILCIALLALAVKARRGREQRARWPVYAPPAEQAQPVVPRAPAPSPGSDSLVSQFEINWKTFASYTQDLLQQKLRELEDAPMRGVKDVREQVAKLSQALSEIKSDLSVARSEVRDTTRGVVEQVATLVEQENQKKAAQDTGESVLRKIETDFERASARFTQLDDTVGKLSDLFTQRQNSAVEERVRAEVERLEAQWQDRVRQFGAELEDAKIQGQGFLVDLEKARALENTLREELKAVTARAEEQARRLDESSVELAAVSRDREIGWKREREAQEQLAALKASEQEAKERVRALEASVSQLDMAAAAGREREEAVARDARLAAAEAASLRGQLLEAQREAQGAHAEALRQQREHDEERGKLNERVKTLNAAVQELNTQISESQGEIERQRKLLAARDEDLAARGKALAGLEADKGRLESETQALTADLEKARHSLANAQQSLELHRIELDDGAQRLRQADAELERLRKSNDIVTAEAAGLRKAAAENAQQARLEKEALEKGVEASLAEVKRLRAVEEEMPRLRTQLAELEHLRRSRTEFGETAARLHAFEKERKDLLDSLDRLNRDLERTRSEADGIRCLQDVLVDSSLPAAIVAFDTAQKVFAWNTRAEGLWGRPASSAIGSRLADLGLKGIERDAAAFASRSMTEKATVQLPQCSFSDSTGRVRHLRLWCDPIRGPRGEILGGVLVGEEITEKVEQEIEARLQALFSQSLAKSLPGALVVLDTSQRVISWNRSAESILGLSERQALGESFFSLATPLAKEGFRRHFESVADDQKPHRVRVRFEHAGVPTQFLVTQAPFLGTDDAVRGTILLLQEALDPAEVRR